MNRSPLAIPELQALAAPSRVVRLPPALDVPLTPRVARLIDTETFRRLASISQLGLVALVYPGATHSRFEHSLGVYTNGLRFLSRLVNHPTFAETIEPHHADAFVLAALLHDIGHWPYCHPIEDMRLPNIPRHEDRAREAIFESELASCIASDWSCSIDDVWRLLSAKDVSPAEGLLQSLLSGPIDIDKLDYLQRDSHHAGVPYGQNFDAPRLVANLDVVDSPPRLALSEKARTAAEMMVFARYVMFSEVYWHHAVRSATAMLQRTVFELLATQRLDLQSLMGHGDVLYREHLRRAAEGTAVAPLAEGLFGPQRKLLKRIAQFDVRQSPEVHQRLARRPFDELVVIARRLAKRLSQETGERIDPTLVLIDAPPVKREVEINIPLVASDGKQRPLATVSPVVEALAKRQFDDVVKRVRIFAPEAIKQRLPNGIPWHWVEVCLDDPHTAP
jgi:uncharacterized protein